MASNTSSRLSSTVQVQTSPTTGLVTRATVVATRSAVPLRKQVFNAASLKTPDDIARQLNTMQTQLHDATLPARTSSRNQSITFEGCIFDAVLGPRPTTEVFLEHGFGTKVRWSVVRWVGPASSITLAGIYEPDADAGTGQQGSQSNPNILILRPTGMTKGTADIEVWSAG